MTQKEEAERVKLKCELFKATQAGNLAKVKEIVAKDKDARTWRTNLFRDTILHMSVRKGHNHLVAWLLLFMIEDAELEILEQKNDAGNTALHVAVFVGNKDAMKLLVGKHSGLLNISNKEQEVPLIVALKYMHFDASLYLVRAAVAKGRKQQDMFRSPDHIELGVAYLVNVICAKQYSTASMLVKNFPELATRNDEVLMAMARNFPSGLDYWEALTYPSLSGLGDQMIWRIGRLFIIREICGSARRAGSTLNLILDCLIVIPSWVYYLLSFPIFMIYCIFCMVYFLWWKIATRLVSPINRIEQQVKKLEEAKQVLKSICGEIEKLGSGTKPTYYSGPLIEATRQDAYEVVFEILHRLPILIGCKDKNGHNLIQLAITHRSEQIHNFICQIIKDNTNSRYQIIDSSKNNILHLVGRLAPSHRLNGRTGAALQLQRELKWREELKNIVTPTFITQENTFKETPDMVFTREHQDLVKEGETWMKTTAESCSITAGLITTIVFAAAITVPGGNNQETGIPMFRKDLAFTIFAISDAISLFTSTTSLLVFLSILTARFSEQDFLIRLPRRLIIGLCTLFLSTTAMIVAFSATLFLVFCDNQPWMIAPICGLACLPIVVFVTLQFPLMVDLFRWTYMPIFGKETIRDYMM